LESNIKLLALITLATVETRTATVAIRAKPIVVCAVAIIAIAHSKLTAETQDTFGITIALFVTFAAMHGVDAQSVVVVKWGALTVWVANAAVRLVLTKAMKLTLRAVAVVAVAHGSHRTIIGICARSGEANCCLITTLPRAVMMQSPATLSILTLSAVAILITAGLTAAVIVLLNAVSIATHLSIRQTVAIRLTFKTAMLANTLRTARTLLVLFAGHASS
jgi:hypothetical protein